MIDIGSDFSGAEVIIDESTQPASRPSLCASGIWADSAGCTPGVAAANADMSMTGDKFDLISGTRNGRSDNASGPATATFKIVVTC